MKYKTLEQKLTKQNLKFIELRAKGLSVVEAYKLAGYKGTHPEQAYQLSHQVKNKVTELIEEDGYNKNSFMLQMSELLKLPLARVNNLGNKIGDVDYLTVEEKLKVLRLFKDTLPEMKKETNVIPRFQIFMNDGGLSVNVNGQQACDAIKSGSPVIDVNPLEDQMDLHPLTGTEIEPISPQPEEDDDKDIDIEDEM